jgi:hypothetical protein
MSHEIENRGVDSPILWWAIPHPLLGLKLHVLWASTRGEVRRSAGLSYLDAGRVLRPS